MIKGFPDRKDSIILAAIDVISERGIQGLSTKEIASKQGISESLLYKHFKSIDEVLISVLEYFSRFDVMIINTVLKRDISYKEKIFAYINSVVELYENYPALASVVLNYETLMRYDHTREITRNIINKRRDFVIGVIELAQSSGEIESYYTPQELTDIIIGTYRNMILRWKMTGYDFQLKEYILTTIEKVLNRS